LKSLRSAPHFRNHRSESAGAFAPLGFGELPSGIHRVGAKLRAFTD
jgi:hypothetical protein